MTGFETSLRPLTRRDFTLIEGWLRQPHVAEWWRDDSDRATVEADYGRCVTGEDPTEVFVIEADGQPIGLIQRYLIEDYPEWSRAMAATPLGATGAGIDYMIGDPAMVGRGIGSTVIRAFTNLTFRRYPQIDAVSAAVQQANPASWRALERAGFARIWAGQLDSDDPSDAGPAFLYVKREPDPARADEEAGWPETPR